MEENAAPPAPPAPAPAPKKRSVWRRIFRFFLWTGLSFVFLLILAVVLGYIYREEVKRYVVAEVNKHLSTTIIVAPEDIDLTVIRSFPNASVEFKNVKALDAADIPKRDTLFSAGKIGLEFNLIDLFRKNYKIRHITADDVALNVWVDKNGRDNYHFLKSTPDTAASDTAHVAFALESIELKNVSLRYRDRRVNSDYKVDLEKAHCSGDFSSDNYTFSADAKFFVHHLKQEKTTYFSDNEGSLDLEVQVDDKAGSYAIDKCSLHLADFALTAGGNIVEQKRGTQLDLAVKGDDIDLAAALSLMPAKYHDKLASYDSEGKLLLDASVKGLYNDSVMPVIKATFETSKGTSLTNTKAALSLEDVVVKGVFSNEPGHSQLDVTSFSFHSGGSKLEGKWRLENFDHPEIEASVEGSIGMRDLQIILQNDTVELAEGAVDVNVHTSGKPADGKTFKTDDLRHFNTTGEITMRNTTLHLKQSPLRVDSLNGKMVFNGNDLSVDNFSGRLAGNDFSLDGTLRNLLPWLLTDKENLAIEATLRSRRLDLNKLLTSEGGEKQTDKSDTTYRLSFPASLRLSLRTEIDHITFRKFEAANLRGNVELRDRKLVVDPVMFSTMDGAVSGSGMIDGARGDSLLITCNAKITKVNISKLFGEMENFGQEVLQEKHLRGLLTADVQFASIWGTDLEANMDKIYAHSDVMIERGELIGFEPMKALSDYIKVTELNDIKFATLKNQVEIRNRKVLIPFMDIESSAMNIGMSGSHGFDNMVDYKFRIRMEEYMARKAKNSRRENEEFGEVEPDGGHRFSLYLSMTGPLDNPKISYDRKSAVQKVKDDIKNEKQNLKQILHEEFGWFKKDSTVTKNDDPKKKKDPKAKSKDDDGKFIIKWDEDDKDKKLNDGDDF